MRRGLVIFLVVNLLIIAFLVRSVSTLLSLLIEDAANDAIHRAELPAPNSPLIDGRPQLIPKIIHQTYVNDSVPERWRDAQQSCIDLHEDYEYKLWTDEKSHTFIATEYPWFLDTFANYSQPIQRADAIRYFILAHFGGVYIDLDYGCNRRLDPLLSYPAWVRKTVPTGISNDAMGATPQHPFFLRVIDSLMEYNKNWHLPYITVMYSTGPLFLSVIWKEYMASGDNVGDGLGGGRVRILMQEEEYNQHAWSFFSHHVGNSWHGSDAKLIFWMGRHWLMLTASGFLVAGVVGAGLWWVYGRVLLLGQMRGRPAPRGGCALWRRASLLKKDYELVERHEV
ncbi:MAG: mannosyl phosphorylinositol ceramide synthase SUR1 [Lasallia pustulata]|uniref:Mannosyl phosphorylinositol ceramide synthase SUR1 n=1 Tax=Lasallia pustulata TaxID=136370 RepID=A0A5M8PDW9_9LECA|nr:MAG: mannosyl phosphorylinositol ceramide synthase SUR1 [Lasallia pustulata]